MHEERLIELVGQNRFLYDKRHRDYKKHVKNERKWIEIGSELNVSSEIVKKRWRTIKDRYFRIKKQKSDPSGSRRAVKYRYARLLKFLDDHDASCDGPYDDFNDEPTTSIDVLDFKDRKGESSDFLINECQTTLIPPEDKIPIKIRTNKTNKTKADPLLTEDLLGNTNNELLLSLLKEVKDSGNPMTKERSFCESLALQLEEANLPSENFRNFQIQVIQLLSVEVSNTNGNN